MAPEATPKPSPPGTARRGMVRQLPLTHAQRMELEKQMKLSAAPSSRGSRRLRVRLPAVTRSRRPTFRASARTTRTSGSAGSFNPSTPSELLYDGTDPDSKIVGLSYLVYHHGGPPPGFAGDNDHWHQHNANGGLCLKGGLVVGGEDSTPQECADRGGHKVLLIDIWMMHTWSCPVSSAVGACSAVNAPNWAAGSAAPPGKLLSRPSRSSRRRTRRQRIA